MTKPWTLQDPFAPGRWLDPSRLRDEYIPSGFKGYKVSHRTAPGHRFGLEVNSEDRAAPVAFLKTL
jgi:hypothetical protein